MAIISTFLDYIIQGYSPKRLWYLFGAFWVLLFSFGILGLYIGIGQTIEETGEMVKVLDAMFNYSEAQAYRQIEAYGEQGRQFSLFATLVVDSLFPLAYGPFFALILAHLLKKTKYRFLILLPILVILVDYLENTHIALLLINYPTKMPLVAYTGSFCTSIKWILLGLTVMSISFGFFLKNRKNFLEYTGEGPF